MQKPSLRLIALFVVAAGTYVAAQQGFEVPWNDKIPAGNAALAARALKESPRHGEWVDISVPGGLGGAATPAPAILKAFVVYPERSDKTGVVLVIHDIRGMGDIPRAVGDQLAQDGYIAIVPDFLSGKGPNGGGTDTLGAGVGQAIQGLTEAEMTLRLNASMDYGKKLPLSNGKTAVIGFCWGGTRSFQYAIAQPGLSGAIVYYGSPIGATADAAPEAELAKIKAPVIGFYGGTDARIGLTVPATEAAMKKLGKSYDPHTFEGAGHGFMGNQGTAANYKAAEEAWPMTIAFLQKNLR